MKQILHRFLREAAIFRHIWNEETMNLTCRHCGRPLERIHSIESEIGEVWHERTEFMCTNIQCRHASIMIHESKRPVERRGYITVAMLTQKGPKEAPKSWLRKLLPERAVSAPVKALTTMRRFKRSAHA